MKKNVLSIAILVLAVGIVGVNLWNANQTTSEPKDQPAPVSESSSAENNEEVVNEEDSISGVDLNEVKEGNPAPDFTLKNLDGEYVKLSDYQGKKVILNLWATWCPPCKAEMPHMQNFYEKNKDNGIEIVAVNLTNMDNGMSAIKDFAEEYGLTFDIPLDEKGTVGMQYQAFTIPTSYMIDSKGIIRKKIVGPMDEKMMEDLTSAMD